MKNLFNVFMLGAGFQAMIIGGISHFSGAKINAFALFCSGLALFLVAIMIMTIIIILEKDDVKGGLSE